MATDIERFENAEGLDNGQMALLISWVASRLFVHGSRDNFPDALDGDDRPRALSISVGDRHGACDVALGIGTGIRGAALDALRTLSARRPLTQPAVVKLDVINRVEGFIQSGDTAPPDTIRSLHGFAIGRPDLAWLPEETLANHLITAAGRFRGTAIQKFLGYRHAKAQLVAAIRTRRPLRLWRFTTDAWYSDGEQTAPLFRGHPVIRKPDPGQIMEAAVAAGHYLTRIVGEGGRFAYIYEPASDSTAPDYNLLRHAGTTWSMLDLYGRTGDTALGMAAERAVAYLIHAIRPGEVSGKPVLCLVEAAQVKLGGHGLALICLAEHARVMKTDRHIALMQGLARWIVLNQAASGEFSIHKANYLTGARVPLISGYYPGEAILGLMRLYAIDRNTAWLNAAARATHWLIESRDGGKTEDQLEHDHWLLYALDALHRHAPSPAGLEHARKLARAIIARQHGEKRYPDWNGGWYRPPRTTPAATRLEGLSAAWRLLRDHGGSAEELNRIRVAIERGIPYLLENQYGPVTAMYLRNPSMTFGGFRGSHEQPEIRIDYVQHCLSALLLSAGEKG